MNAATGLLVLGCVVTTPVMGQSSKDKRCQLMVERAGELLTQRLFGGNENWYGSGGVHMRCVGQEVFLEGDSAVVTNGQVVQFITAAKYRDKEITIDADTMMYTQFDERIQARGNVVIVQHADGARLTGHRADYLRVAPGIRDSAEMSATSQQGRTHVTLPVHRSPGDSTPASPYLIEADGVRRVGSLTRAWGTVMVDRDSLSGRGDSLAYFSGSVDEAILVGKPATMVRSGADSFRVAGETVTLGLLGEELTSIGAKTNGHIVAAAGDVMGDDVLLKFTDGDLVHTEAWGGKEGAQLLSDGYNFKGDSIAIETPGELLSKITAIGGGKFTQPLDTTMAAQLDPETGDTLTPIQNAIGGQKVEALFIQTDSAGVQVTRLVQLTATGLATSLFTREVSRNGEPSPTINYTTADTIIVVMETGDSSGVKVVRAYSDGQPVHGVQLERVTIKSKPADRPSGGLLPGRDENNP